MVSMSKAPLVFVTPVVTSCVLCPVDIVLDKDVLYCDLRQLPSLGTFWIIGNDGWLGESWMFWTQSFSLIAELPHSQSSPTVSSACTKVLYFTDRSLTPFMVNIPKRWDSRIIISLLKKDRKAESLVTAYRTSWEVVEKYGVVRRAEEIEILDLALPVALQGTSQDLLLGTDTIIILPNLLSKYAPSQEKQFF